MAIKGELGKSEYEKSRLVWRNNLHLDVTIIVHKRIKKTIR
jgi:hypothetical protein